MRRQPKARTTKQKARIDRMVQGEADDAGETRKLAATEANAVKVAGLRR